MQSRRRPFQAAHRSVIRKGREAGATRGLDFVAVELYLVQQFDPRIVEVDERNLGHVRRVLDLYDLGREIDDLVTGQYPFVDDPVFRERGRARAGDSPLADSGNRFRAGKTMPVSV